MRDAERAKRIKNGGNNGLRSADAPCLTGSLDAQRVGLCRHLAHDDIKSGQVGGTRQRVIHEARAQQLPSVRIVAGLLHQRLSDALGKAAVHLASGQERVDQGAIVVDRMLAQQRYRPGIRIDLDLGHLRAVRECIRRIPTRAVGAEGLAVGDRYVTRDRSKVHLSSARRVVPARREHDRVGRGL
jgi:hypothetical protein